MNVTGQLSHFCCSLLPLPPPPTPNPIFDCSHCDFFLLNIELEFPLLQLVSALICPSTAQLQEQFWRALVSNRTDIEKKIAVVMKKLLDNWNFQ